MVNKSNELPRGHNMVNRYIPTFHPSRPGATHTQFSLQSQNRQKISVFNASEFNGDNEASALKRETQTLKKSHKVAAGLLSRQTEAIMTEITNKTV